MILENGKVLINKQFIGQLNGLKLELDLKVGDEVLLTLEAIEDGHGNTKVSREKAIKQQSWNKLQESYDNNTVVTGIPFNIIATFL